MYIHTVCVTGLDSERPEGGWVEVSDERGSQKPSPCSKREALSCSRFPKFPARCQISHSLDPVIKLIIPAMYRFMRSQESVNPGGGDLLLLGVGFGGVSVRGLNSIAHSHTSLNHSLSTRLNSSHNNRNHVCPPSEIDRASGPRVDRQIHTQSSDSMFR